MLKVNNKLLIFICVFVGVCEQYILASVLNIKTITKPIAHPHTSISKQKQTLRMGHKQSHITLYLR